MISDDGGGAGALPPRPRMCSALSRIEDHLLGLDLAGLVQEVEPGRRERHPQTGGYYTVGLMVLTLCGTQICAMTRFDASTLPRFGLPLTLP